MFADDMRGSGGSKKVNMFGVLSNVCGGGELFDMFADDMRGFFAIDRMVQL